MSEETTQQPQEQNQKPIDQQSNVELTVNDLNALKQIIDVASSRGVFKPNEMAVVGTTYNKLENFLQAVAAQQKENSND